MRPRPAPFSCRSHCNQGFTLGLSAENTFFLAAPVGFIDFHYATQPLPPRTYHRPPQLVQPRPGRLVAAQPENALQTQRAGPVLLRGHVPDRPEPQPQRFARVLEDRAGGHRRLPPAAGALPPHLTHRPSPLMPACRTAETVRPAQPEQVVPTGLLGPEPRLELDQVAWVILHEPAYYILGLPESNGYPTLGKSGEPVRRLLLVEQPDGSWRKISGKDLVELHERFPNFLKSLEPLDWSDL